MASLGQALLSFAFLFAALSLATVAPVSGGRLLLQTPASTGPLPVSRVELSLEDTLALLRARLAYVQSLAGGGGSSSGVSSFAAARVPLGGPGAPLGGFTVNVKIGIPAVTVPVTVDTFSSLTWVQGPDCAFCPGSAVCGTPDGMSIVGFNGGQTSCPYSGPVYFPTLSSTSVLSPDCNSVCADTSENSFFLGCGGNLGLPADQCEYTTNLGGLGIATGRAVLDTLSIGSVSTLGQKILLGSSILEPGSRLNGAGGVAGFSPDVRSLPNQLKAVGAVSTATFAVCLASGGSNSGSLFLGGVPPQPGSLTPYQFSIAAIPSVPADLIDNAWLVPPPTDLLVNGFPAPGAAAALVIDPALGDPIWTLDSALDITVLSTPAFTALFNSIRTFSGCPNVFTDFTVDLGIINYIDLTTCNPPVSANPTADEIGARFPPIAIVIPGGTRLTATAKSYAKLGNFGPGGELALSPGLIGVNSAGNQGIIGSNFLTDNMIVFDSEGKRVGFAPVDCNTLQPLAKPNIPLVTTPAPTTPAPTTPAPTTPAPTTPEPTTPAPTTPEPTTPTPTTSAPTTSAPTTSAPTTSAPTTSAPTTAAPTTAAPTTAPEPTTAAPTTPAPTTGAPTPAPTTGVFPAGGVCDAFSAFPNQCFSSDGSKFTCCPVGVSCAQPGSIPRCTGFASSADAPTPTTLAPTTSAPTPSAPTTSAPTTAPEPVTPAPTTAAPITAAPTTPAPTTAGPVTPSPTFVTGSAPCDPGSATPNQCFNAGGSLFICCAGACPSTPGVAPICA